MVAQMTLGGLPMRTKPTEVRWNFKMKTVETRTMGGKVIQVLGTTLGDLTVRGAFGTGNRAKGDTEGWQQQHRFRRLVESWTSVQETRGHPKSLRFTYAPRKWDFEVYIKSFAPVHMDVREINPLWELVLFPVDEGSRKIVEAVKDLYIKRLMNGVGWKQSAYNGPTQAEVDATLGGRSVLEYLSQGFQDAYDGALSTTTDPTTGGTP